MVQDTAEKQVRKFINPFSLDIKVLPQTEFYKVILVH